MAYKNVNGKLVKIEKAPHLQDYGYPKAVPFRREDTDIHEAALRSSSAIRKYARQTAEMHTKKELPEDKGKYNGHCNMSSCLAPGAVYWNRGSYAYYCKACAKELNHVNRNDAFLQDGKGPLCQLVEEDQIEKPYRLGRG